MGDGPGDNRDDGRYDERDERQGSHAARGGTAGHGHATRAELWSRAAEFERLADATPAIDPWCSGPDWVIAANEAFAPESTPRLVEADNHGVALLADYDLGDGTTAISGLEPLWGFASPLLSPHPAGLADLLATVLRDDPRWRFIVLPGLPPDQRAVAVARPLAVLGEVRARVGITRQVADIGEGRDAWLERRSPRFRKAIRQATRRAGTAGLELVDVDNAVDVYARCLSVEARSWKGIDDDGLISPPMGRFYEIMTERLAAGGRMVATIAVLDGRDVGFIFGGVRGTTYRGLQLSYTDDVRHLSVSHLLQFHTLGRLEQEFPEIDTYDLGMDMDYKRRWADDSIDTVSLMIERNLGRGTPNH